MSAFFYMLAVKLNISTLGIYACRLKGAAVDSNLILPAAMVDWPPCWIGRSPAGTVLHQESQVFAPLN